MLRRLADNETVWVDVPTLADEIVVSDRVDPPNPSERAPVLAAIGNDDLETARWWVQHLK